ncbi:ral GTPase-activating protein subunit beta isoform X2 [Lingula anatina]|uniref:Ral GTPase-activating protein subunit beta isoform X2 n=1 Tax=Lingula anatina TaxID=7574 RepID=A0A1S3I098_LINAN|nr:ral GTPase-activating protein subunit beta isoform X2 [Lingula anatina]|eukprot:XP_013391687.1 ral GTPase-activating protein subunit beta isoform X2 [Lingula anatina]
MYSEWASLQTSIQIDTGNTSVLQHFPAVVGKDVAGAVVKHLASSLSLGVTQGEQSSLNSDKEVKWTMEVICFGMTLNFSDNHETIRDCVNVYCEWLSALTTPKNCVPVPVREQPNHYCQIMFKHLYNLFVPRPAAVFDSVKRQTVLCHRILRHLQMIVQESTILTRETWEAILRLLLAINDTLLAPPIRKDDIGDQLCERVLSVLFEIWLQSCLKCFPSPSLWKTFRDMCLNWRHHEVLVVQWHRINSLLTSHLIPGMFGPDFPEFHISEEDRQLIPPTTSPDTITQAWFRFLHILSNPVELSNIQVISQTPKFLHMALASEDVIDPSHHDCLKVLPQIFFRAMKGIAVLVDAFMGIAPPWSQDETNIMLAGIRQTYVTPVPGSSTPPSQRKNRGFSMSSGQYSVKGAIQKAMGSKTQPPATFIPSDQAVPFQLSLDSRSPYAPARPKCNSLLHLFGAWLFDGALVGVKSLGKSGPPSRRTSFLEAENQHTSPTPEHESPQEFTVTNEIGRAEACGALCKIFCAKKTGEDIQQVYLARFYTALHYGLATDKNMSGQVLSNILFNSTDVLRLDLVGVLVLVPRILQAVVLVLRDLIMPFRCHDQISSVELRKASIHLLLSMLCLPLHFRKLEIKALHDLPMSDSKTTFWSLRVKLIETLLRALTIETDPSNTLMLLGGLMLSVQDLSMYEEAEQVTVQKTQDLLGTLYGTIGESGEDAPPSEEPASGGGEEGETVKAPQQPPKDYDTAYDLFGHAASLVCNRLMASWKMDLNIALAAMEVLAGLAKIRLHTPNILMCKRTVKWICDFIVYQCSRPAPAHSRDLHSMIVAAFQCLSLWLIEHHYLMLDKECLHYVLEVVELGLSGSKSQPRADEPTKGVHFGTPQNRASDPPKLKHEKTPMPASARVQTAAESVLNTIIGLVGAYPLPCGPEALCSLLDEDALLKYCRGGGLPEDTTTFKYFVLENSIIVGLLEQPLGNEQDPLPTVTALIRGPFGRHAWAMQLRHAPRSQKFTSRSLLSDPKYPQPVEQTCPHPTVTPRYFPESVDDIPGCLVDQSIPSMESIVKDPKHDADHLKMLDFISSQRALENNVGFVAEHKKKNQPFPNTETICKPPSICQDFQTARMFLSHYGFLSLEALKEPGTPTLAPPLVMLDSSDPGLSVSLGALDDISTRTWDTAYLFYVKAGQKRMQDIVSNVSHRSLVQPHFIEFLESLGWPVNVRKHTGWTGHVSSSWKITDNGQDHSSDTLSGEVFTPASDTGGSVYDGHQKVLYWADAAAEIAFVVPSHQTQSVRRGISTDCETGVSAQGRHAPRLTVDQKSSSMASEYPSSSEDLLGFGRAHRRGGMTVWGPDVRILVVWLERYEDHADFPTVEACSMVSTGMETLQPNKQSDLKDQHVIFIHALKSGLFRIHVKGLLKHRAGPLVDGMVVSRRSLGTLVRQTAINIGKRKRLDSEMYQPPHVRRHMKVREIVNKYRTKLPEPEFYTALFQDGINSK